MSPHLRKRLIRLALIATLAAGLLCVIGVIAWVGRPSPGVADAAPPADLATLEAIERSFNWIAETVKPAVVFIEAEQMPLSDQSEEELVPPGPFVFPPDADPEQLPDWFRDWFRDYFGPEGPSAQPYAPRRPQPMPRMPLVGQGSGVVIDPDGYIVTNYHVVRNAAKIRVHLPSGETYTAQMVGADQLSDLAVIRIKPDRPLIAGKLGDADTAKVGSWTMAIGYPFGAIGYSQYGGASGRFDEPLRYEPTVTVGVVSALDRQIESDIPGRPFRHLIQTDAPINRGSSGGPLLSARAEVIGINQAIFTSRLGGGNIGVGFAIPIDAGNKEIIEALKRGEAVVRGQLGVEIIAVSTSISEVYGADHGVFIAYVYPDSPAARGGLKDEDIVLEYDGTRTTSVDQFVGAVQRTRPGKTVEVKVLRDGEPVTLNVTVQALSLEVAETQPPPVEKDKLGLTVEALPADTAEEMGLSGGVRVRNANPMGDAFRSGIRSGDVIVKINRQIVTDLESYNPIVRQLEPGDAVVIRAQRGDRTITAQIERLSE